MLPRRYCLKRRDRFDLIYQGGKRVSGSCLTLHYLPHPDRSALALDAPFLPNPSDPSSKLDPESALQIAFVASKKVSRLSVGRNRVKRRLREAFRPYLHSLKPGYWLIVVARSSVLTTAWSDLSAEVARLLQKARLLA